MDGGGYSWESSVVDSMSQEIPQKGPCFAGLCHRGGLLDGGQSLVTKGQIPQLPEPIVQGSGCSVPIGKHCSFISHEEGRGGKGSSEC